MPPGPFVGRAAPLAELRGAVAAGTAGGAAVVLVAGEPGIGKTGRDRGRAGLWPHRTRRRRHRRPGLAAGERASRDRIAPALRHQPGGVRQFVLWQPEQRRQVIITLATSLEALEEAGKKIQQPAALLPDEDAALLPGPDHVEIFRV